MNLICLRCKREFTEQAFRVNCPECVAHYEEIRKRITAAQNPVRGVHLDGKFFEGADVCPKSGVSPSDGEPVCALCGSDEMQSEYGLCGFGCGTFVRCWQCGAVHDFCEDTGE